MKMYSRILAVIITFASINLIAQDNNDNIYLKTNIGHTDAIQDVVLSSDNKYLITASEDKSLIIWDFETEKEIETIKGHENNISCVDINNDNSIIVSGEGSADETINYGVKLWNVETGKEIQTIKPKAGRLRVVKFTDNENNLLIGGSKKLLLYDIEAKSLIREYVGFNTNLKNISFSLDKKYVSAYDENKIYLWDINERKPIQIIESNQSEFTSICLGAKGDYIVAGCEDNSIKVYNTINGEEESRYTKYRNAIFQLAMDEKNEIVVSSDKSSKFFKILEFDNGKEINTIDAHDGRVGKIKISSNNLFIITAGSWDRKVKVWNIKSGELIKTFSGVEKNRFQRVYIDSLQYYALGSQRNNVFVNFMSKHKTNKKISGNQGEVACVTMNKDNSLIAFAAENYFMVLDLSSNDEVFSSSVHKSWIRNIAFSPDGKYLATTSYKELKIWDISSGSLLFSIDKKFKIPHNIAFSNNSELIAVGGKKATKIFELETGKKKYKLKTKNVVKSLDFSDDDELLATGNSKASKDGNYKVNVWKIGEKKAFKTLEGHEYNVSDIEFGKSKNILISSGKYKIRVWDLESSKYTKEIDAHARVINDIEIGDNDKEIISSSEDGTVKIWDKETGNLLLTNIGFKDSEDWISFTPDGRFDGTNNGIKAFYFVKDMKIVPLENLYEKFYTPKLNAQISRKLNADEISLEKLQNLPDVAITKPSAEVPMFRGSVETLLSTDEKVANVMAKITDMGGGIDEIRVYQNNKLIENKDVDINNKGDNITQEFDINLAKGLNVIEIAGYNNDRTKKSKKIGIEYTGDEFNPANLYVFAIGINNYKKPSYNLNYAISDANSFVKELTQNSSLIFKNTTVISLTDKQATKDSILNCFNLLKKKVEQNDVFVFYYAGHGSMSAPEPYSEAEFHLIPWEVTNLYNNQMLQTMGISAHELQAFSKEIKAQKQLFVLDACQSGGAVEYFASRGAEKERAIAQLAHSTGTYFITASGSQQLAGEFGSLGHGVFTYAILEGLKGKASLTNDKVTVKGLTVFVEEQVPALSEKYKGNAQYPASYGFGQDFPLVLITNK